jgi:ABC-type uncharacterized transport system ATPase subunit
VLGLSKREINEKIDEIIDFAEMMEFIDAPVQSYSSGMQVRLGFSIATALSPDILLLDEVLAVGDIRFQAKCFTRIAKLKKNCTVIFVSHSKSSMARISNTALLLEKGGAISSGNTADVMRQYEALTLTDGSKSIFELSTERGGSHEVRIARADFSIMPSTNNLRVHSTKLHARVVVIKNESINTCILDVVFRRMDGSAVAECPININLTDIRVGDRKTIGFEIDPFPLSSGIYTCSLFLMDLSCMFHYDVLQHYTSIRAVGDDKFTSPIQLDYKDFT